MSALTRVLNKMRPLGLLLAVVFLGGCHQFTITNGDAAPDKEPAPTYKERRHSAIVGDIVTIQKPGRLDLVCPRGWARIEREITFFDGVLGLVAGWFYRADTLTLYCDKNDKKTDAAYAATVSPPAAAAAPTLAPAGAVPAPVVRPPAPPP